MSQWVLTVTVDSMPIQTLRRLTPDERNSPVIIKRMKDFYEHTNKNYGDIMNILMYQYSSRNIYPEQNYEPSNANSGELEDIYVPYEGYEDGYSPLMVPYVDDIKDYDIYMESEVVLIRDGYPRQNIG